MKKTQQVTILEGMVIIMLDDTINRTYKLTAKPQALGNRGYVAPIRQFQCRTPMSISRELFPQYRVQDHINVDHYNDAQ